MGLIGILSSGRLSLVSLKLQQASSYYLVTFLFQSFSIHKQPTLGQMKGPLNELDIIKTVLWTSIQAVKGLSTGYQAITFWCNFFVNHNAVMWLLRHHLHMIESPSSALILWKPKWIIFYIKSDFDLVPAQHILIKTDIEMLMAWKCWPISDQKEVENKKDMWRK